jgi:hypothetical protein
MPLIVEEETINRVPYEICVLKAMREQLRCREIWVVGSRRYRNPEEDLPLDFEEHKSAYFKVLGVPMEHKAFTSSLKEELTHHLKIFDGSIPLNHKVKIVKKKDDYRISVTPLKPQKEPENLTILSRRLMIAGQEQVCWM